MIEAVEMFSEAYKIGGTPVLVLAAIVGFNYLIYKNQPAKSIDVSKSEPENTCNDMVLNEIKIIKNSLNENTQISKDTGKRVEDIWSEIRK